MARLTRPLDPARTAQVMLTRLSGVTFLHLICSWFYLQTDCATLQPHNFCGFYITCIYVANMALPDCYYYRWFNELLASIRDSSPNVVCRTKPLLVSTTCLLSSPWHDTYKTMLFLWTSTLCYCVARWVKSTTYIYETRIFILNYDKICILFIMK